MSSILCFFAAPSARQNIVCAGIWAKALKLEKQQRAMRRLVARMMIVTLAHNMPVLIEVLIVKPWL